jgi:sialic acid synthase
VLDFRIGSRWVGEGHPAFITAEIGTNHMGQPAIAHQMIDTAAFCGVDAVKFQKRNVDRILTREGLNAPYTGPHSFGPTYGEHRRALEFSFEVFQELKRHADDKGLVFLASGWDEESVDFLDELGVPAFKIASADVTNHPLLEHIARKGKPVILSTGMSTLAEVDEAVAILRRFNVPFALLQCTSTYPSRFDEINLRVIQTYRERYGCVAGYSGHELGIVIPSVAVALGAKIIERHFTMDRTWKGSDQAASLEPQGLQKMVRDIRHVEEAMGDGQKHIYESEVPVRLKLAKSVVSAVDIPKGTVITQEMLTTKGPGSGISPVRLHDVIGKRAARGISEDEVIKAEDIV